MTKPASTTIARAKSTLINPKKPSSVATALEIAPMHAISTAHARNRVTGPASSSENTMPSGVRMSSVLVLPWRIGSMASVECRVPFRLQSPLAAGPGEEQREQAEFDGAKTDLGPVRDDRFVILGEERLDKPGPHQQNAHAKYQRHQIAREVPQP